jgi:uncharacterized protein YndB with AHSA1/START domain
MTMSIDPDGLLEQHDGKAVLRFERVLHHPPEAVWRALTEPAELRRWHPSPFELDARPGGTVSYLQPDADTLGPEGVVTDIEPLRLLAYTWGEDHLRFELHPHEAGTRLVLVHTFDDRFKAARDAAGWHLCLDDLAAAFDGGAPTPVAETAIPTGWKELNAVYEERFGIPPEDATPPPLDVS